MTNAVLETIVVGTDGSQTATKAVDLALTLAEKAGARFVVASSYRPVSEDRVSREQKDAPHEVQWSINPMEDVDADLRAVEDKARERGLETVSEARQGDPAEVLCSVAAQHDADLIVVGSKGMNRRVLGSVPNTVSHRAPCSVLIVKTV